MPLHGRVDLLFVPDEETGGEYGTGALTAACRLPDDTIGMLLPEPTSGMSASSIKRERGRA